MLECEDERDECLGEAKDPRNNKKGGRCARELFGFPPREKFEMEMEVPFDWEGDFCLSKPTGTLILPRLLPSPQQSLFACHIHDGKKRFYLSS
jgi:hypothetical protein